MKRLGQNPNTLYISTACYSDNTKRLLEEINERLRVSPNKAAKESFWELTDDLWSSPTIYDWLRDQKKIINQHAVDALLYSVPKYTIYPDGCKCEWYINDAVRLYSENDCLATLEALKYFDTINKTNNKKETEKMDAKRCDRCGKFYDVDESQNYINAYMPGKYVSEYERENYTEAKIRQDHTSSIRVVYYGNDKNPVDLCPECRKKLKNFFESGKDGDMELPIRDINAEE